MTLGMEAISALPAIAAAEDGSTAGAGTGEFIGQEVNCRIPIQRNTSSPCRSSGSGPFSSNSLRTMVCATCAL